MKKKNCSIKIFFVSSVLLVFSVGCHDRSIDDTKDPPIIDFDPASCSFGEVIEGSTKTLTLTVTNQEAFPVMLSVLGQSCSCVQVVNEANEIAPKSSTQIDIVYTADVASNAFDTSGSHNVRYLAKLRFGAGKRVGDMLIPITAKVHARIRVSPLAITMPTARAEGDDGTNRRIEWLHIPTSEFRNIYIEGPRYYSLQERRRTNDFLEIAVSMNAGFQPLRLQDIEVKLPSKSSPLARIEVKTDSFSVECEPHVFSYISKTFSANKKSMRKDSQQEFSIQAIGEDVSLRITELSWYRQPNVDLIRWSKVNEKSNSFSVWLDRAIQNTAAFGIIHVEYEVVEDGRKGVCALPVRVMLN